MRSRGAFMPFGTDLKKTGFAMLFFAELRAHAKMHWDYSMYGKNMSKKSKRSQSISFESIELSVNSNGPVNRSPANQSTQNLGPTGPINKRFKHARLIVLIAIFIPLAYFGGRQINSNFQIDKVKRAVREFDDRAALEQLRQMENKGGKRRKLSFYEVEFIVILLTMKNRINT